MRQAGALLNDVRRHHRVNFPGSVAGKIGSPVPMVAGGVANIVERFARHQEHSYVILRIEQTHDDFVISTPLQFLDLNFNLTATSNYMKTTRRFSRNRFFSLLRVATAGTLLTGGAAMAFVATKPSSPDAASAVPENGVYIVQMAAAPVASYTGDIAGYRTTKPSQGHKVDPLAADTVRYVSYLKGKHDEALRKVRGGAKVYDYAMSFNGFAAKLTTKQADALARQKDVLAVTPDELVNQDTSSTPHFLGLDAPGGLWEQLGGPTGGKHDPGAGEDIIIGVVDSGIWPQSKSFSDRDANGKLIYNPIGGFHGSCEGSSRDGSWHHDCNKKLISARHFNAAWGGDAAIQAQRPWEFVSPRDYNGHGTHTTSTAGGNNGVPTTGPAAGFGPTSGMAPRARVAMYKALWSTQDASTASGFTSEPCRRDRPSCGGRRRCYQLFNFGDDD